MKHTKLFWIIVLLLLLVAGCSPLQKFDNNSVYSGLKNYDRFELPQLENECNYDSDCYMGGCNGETCTANNPQVTTCDAVQKKIENISCKCINKECIWIKNEK